MPIADAKERPHSPDMALVAKRWVASESTWRVFETGIGLVYRKLWADKRAIWRRTESKIDRTPMGNLTEPDFAFSVVVPPQEAELVPVFIDDCWWLESCADYLFTPDNPAGPFELVRGIGVDAAEWTRDYIAKNNCGVRVCRWDEVGPEVLRAPKRVPGYVGRHFSFVTTNNRAFEGLPPLSWDKPEATWKDQAFDNHQHPGMAMDDDVEQDEEFIANLRSDLEALFPSRRFVIEHQPGFQVTFYEPGEGAPTESSDEWESQISPQRSETSSAFAEMLKAVKPDLEISDTSSPFVELLKTKKPDLKINDYGSPDCFECGGVKIPEEAESAEHPGVIFAYCANCGKRYLASTRCMRYKVGPW
jgi:hypothetical protein